MSKTILITGASTGIGRATAHYFADHGWDVAATMRQPLASNELGQWPNVLLLPLDVTDPASIAAALAETLHRFGQLDAVLNNAGVAALSAFEATREATIRTLFETNVFGAMNVSRAVLPHFRRQGHGVLLNVTSMGGRVTFPLFSAYHASKFALEGFSESLQFELEPFGIAVKVIEPGAYDTNLFATAMSYPPIAEVTAYESYQTAYLAYAAQAAAATGNPADVAAKIYEAATDGRRQLRYVVGADAEQLLAAKTQLTQEEYYDLIKGGTSAA